VGRGGRRISPYWEPFDPPSLRTPAWITWYCDGLECKEQYGGSAETDPNTFSSKAACELECPTESGGEDTGAGWVCKKRALPPSMEEDPDEPVQGDVCTFVQNNSKYATEQACMAECFTVAEPQGPDGESGGGWVIPMPGSTHRGPGVTAGGMPFDGLTHGDYTDGSQSTSPYRYYCEPPAPADGSMGTGVCLVCPQDEDGYYTNPHNGWSCDTLEDCQQLECGVPGCDYETWDCRLYGAVGQEWAQCSMRMDCGGMFTDEQACKNACEDPPEEGEVNGGPWTDPGYFDPGANPPTQPTTPGG
jgi:hypothetical protein